MIIIKDVTQLIKYQQTERENKLYELFFATISHEMRTPLNSILSLIKVVILMKIPANAKKILEII